MPRVRSGGLSPNPNPNPNPNQVDYLICTAELYLAAVLHDDDGMCMARLNGMLWSRVSQPDAPVYDGWKCAEAKAPVMVRYRHPVAATAEPVTYELCELRGRTAILSDSRSVCTVLSLTPAAPQSSEPPVGMQSWPIDGALKSLMETQDDMFTLGPDMLEDLGIEVGDVSRSLD